MPVLRALFSHYGTPLPHSLIGAIFAGPEFPEHFSRGNGRDSWETDRGMGIHSLCGNPGDRKTEINALGGNRAAKGE